MFRRVPPVVRSAMWRIALCGLACAWAGRITADPTTPTPAAPVRSTAIQGAIDRGVAFLKGHARQTGAGQQSLLAMALLKCGIPADAPEVRSAIDQIQLRIRSGRYVPAVPHEHIYEAGVSLMALANADATRYQPQIRAIAEYIISQQGTNGDWDYPARTTGDTSISQYAILGLWEAVRSGVDVPGRVWDRAAAWHVSRQLSDGSFVYHPLTSNAAQMGSYTMTVAGTGSLHVCRMHLYPEARDLEAVGRTKKAPTRRFGVLEVADDDTAAEESKKPQGPYQPTVRLAAIDRGISRGMAWLENRFTVDPDQPWKLYYLYGVERLTALGGLEQVAGHDWYKEGSDLLLARQLADGSWNDQSGNAPATSFGVLFLSKATAKMLNRPERRPRFGAGLLAGGRGLPENLTEVQVEKGQVQVRKLAGPIDELLAELESAAGSKTESAQAGLVEQVVVEDASSLVGKKDRLMVLVRDRRPEVRRTAYWALGRTDNLEVAPALIAGLTDPDADCAAEAENGLRFLSRKVDGIGAAAPAVAQWKKWYLSVRPYDERDDLSDVVAP